jgi:hypothetical protein
MHGMHADTVHAQLLRLSCLLFASIALAAAECYLGDSMLCLLPVASTSSESCLQIQGNLPTTEVKENFRPEFHPGSGLSVLRSLHQSGVETQTRYTGHKWQPDAAKRSRMVKYRDQDRGLSIAVSCQPAENVSILAPFL